ncbi:hypothetical protein EMCRGX_G006583, partial [Ephydatia muelleri]
FYSELELHEVGELDTIPRASPGGPSSILDTLFICSKAERVPSLRESDIGSSRAMEWLKMKREEKLRAAAKVGDLKMIVRLLDQSADVDAAERDGWTPLMMASYWGKGECVKALLDRGAHANLQNNRGDTALHIAARLSGYKG